VGEESAPRTGAPAIPHSAPQSRGELSPGRVPKARQWTGCVDGGSAIGGSGLGLYYLAFRAVISLNIVAAGLPDVWWRFPVLVLSALQGGIWPTADVGWALGALASSLQTDLTVSDFVSLFVFASLLALSASDLSRF
jgi:hypothetical protein